jgi:integrase
MDETQEKAEKLQQKLNNSPMILLSEFAAKQKGEQLQVQRKKPDNVNQASDFWLQRPDVDKIIASARSLRDRCLIKLLYFGMVRRNEARSLRIEDLDFARCRLNLKITKRSKPRVVPVIEPGVFEDLRLHVGKRNTGWVFMSTSKDGRLSNKAINDIVGATAQLAGVKQPNPRRKNLNPHIFRHSYARYLRRRQPPIAIEVLQKLLGHADVKTTLGTYGTADLDFMESELRRCLL